MDTVQAYSHTEADEVEDISVFDIIPLKLKVGEAAIASEKVAVMVTTDEFDTVNDEGVDDNVTVGVVVSIIMKVKLSLPVYALPAKSVPDTVAVVEVSDVDTVHVYSQIEAEDVADITTFETIPLKLKVGVADIASENVAVMETTSELEIILSESESVRVRVGAELSIVKVILSVPE